MASRDQSVIKEDVKGSFGLWLKSYGQDGIVYHTRAGKLWNNVNSRCLPSLWKRQPAYEGTSNSFTDFQTFVEWCHSQKGYMEVESGRFWQLDKDLLVPGNKIYSPETCVFVPVVVNSVLRERKVSEYKAGVELYKYDGVRFIAKCTTPFGGKYLGIYETEDEAHQAWRVEKLRHIDNMRKVYKKYPLVVKALEVSRSLI